MFSKISKLSKQLVVLTLLTGVLVMPVSPLVAEEISDVVSAPVVSSPIVVDVATPEPVVPSPVEVPAEVPVVIPQVEVLATSTPVVECLASTTDPVVQTAQAPALVTESAPVAQAETLATEPLIIEDNFTTLAGEADPNLPVIDPVVAEALAESDEDTFQTLAGTPIETPDNLAISDENPFGEVINLENLAISDELNGETILGEIDNPWADSSEDSFLTLNQPVDTNTISNEGSFNTTSTPVDTLTVSGENSFDTQVAVIDNSTVSGENSFTTTSAPVDNLTVSGENNFTTLVAQTDTLTVSDENSFTTTSTPVNNLTVSDENNFITLPGGTTDDPTISDENSFITTSTPVNNLTVSDENNFTTATAPVDNLTVSDEQNFTTTSTPVDNLTVSDEDSFTTLNSPTDNLTVSDELNFVTLSNPIDNLTVSDELSFTTDSNPIINPTVSDEDSFTTEKGTVPPVNPPGGGGGGGGGGYVLGEQTYKCPVYLKKFIKFGEANDRREVIKLQAFLKVYEGFKNLKITGTYDRQTFEAVKIFQSRYLRDVLKPWQIDYSTGWVYITTRLAINNIYCGRDTANDLHFRKEVAYEYQLATGEDINAPINDTDDGYFITPTTTEATTSTTTLSVIKPNVFLAGVGELLNFIGDNFCWLLNLLLLLLIFFLLWLLWQLSRDDEEGDGGVTTVPLADELEVPLPPGAVHLEDIIYPEDEEELAKLAEEDEIKLEELDNNPWQEAIELGPETLEKEEELAK